MNKTESQLSNECKKLNWYCQKLNTHNISGYGNEQVSDFLVANNNGVYAIECKERKNYFNSKDLTQSLQMRKLLKKSNKFIPYILLNFYGDDKLFLIPFSDYKLILKNNKFKNGNNKIGFTYKDFDKKYLIILKDLYKHL